MRKDSTQANDYRVFLHPWLSLQEASGLIREHILPRQLRFLSRVPVL
jgi:hypothetical protein